MIFRCSPRRSTLLRGLLASIVLLCLVAAAQAAQVLYATGVGSVAGSGLTGLYTIDLRTGAATAVQQLGAQVYGGGLAYDAETDTLYATGFLSSDPGTTRLFIIDRFTGTVTPFPGMSPTINLSQSGLAINPVTGVMYATGQNGFQSMALFTIDKHTGAATLVGQCGGECCKAPFGFQLNGLGFRGDGTLFANGYTLDNSASHLFTLDLTSGLATDIGPHGVTVGRALKYSGLAFGAEGTMYSLGSATASVQALYSVDPFTGAATVIGDTVIPFGVDGGLAFAPDQPVPQPAALSITVTPTNTLVLSWPTNAVNSFPYVLHENISFNPATWVAVTNEPAYSGGRRTVILPFPSTIRFYRLKTP